MYPREANASFCVVCCVKLYFVFLGPCLVKMFHLCPACNQDVHPSKGKFCVVLVCTCVICMQLSFRLSAASCQDVSSFGKESCLHVCMCACALCVQLSCCQDVPSFGSFLSRCFIFRRGKLCLYVCVHVHCVCNFRAVKMLHLSAASRQDVPSFGEESCVCMCACMCIVCATFVLSRCCIFRQLLVKMFHLSARKVVFLYVFVHVHCVCNFRAVKMLHLLAASRQDVPSFGEESCDCMCACMCIVCATFVLSRCCIFWQLLVKMFHLSARKVVFVCVRACALCVQLSCCQDVASFGCIVCATFMLSRCCIFRQLLVKMFHLSTRKVVFVCVRACALCVQLSCCQDVASFGSFSSRCSIFWRGKLCLYVCVHVHCVCNFRAVKMLHLSAASRQDVPSFGEESCVCMCACMCIVCATFVLSRCCIFWQLLVKMFHLSARKVVFVCVRACALCVQLSCCQDVASFGSFSSKCSIFRRGKLCLYVCVHVHCVCNLRAVKMFHLSAASRQDVMFWQFLVKISIFCVFYSLCICIVFVKMFQCVYASFCSRGSVILF